MQFHHRIVYPDGTVYEGEIDHQPDIDGLGLKSVEGLRVLDIATNDGFFAFWAEQNGASEVVAIDVGNYKDYDWGFAGPPQTEDLAQQDKWEVFDFHHRNLKSSVVKRQMSVYDIEALGEFDVIFNYGLIYHLRNPVLALDKCRAVCKGFAVVESETAKLDPYMPVSLEMGDDVGLGSITDTYLPTKASMASWMRKACFPSVVAQKVIWANRSTVIGIVDPKYEAWFTQHEKCDETYWHRVRKRLARVLQQ